MHISSDSLTQFGDELVMVLPDELERHEWYPSAKFSDRRHKTLFKYAGNGVRTSQTID
jgi:hypothetical protein